MPATPSSPWKWKMAKRDLPRLIIMDVMMPGTDGLTALRELKKAEATKAIPVIVATANVEQHLAARQEAQFSGAAAFLTKPLSPAQLLSERSEEHTSEFQS